MKPISREELRKALWPTTDPDYKIRRVCNNVDRCACCNIADCKLRKQAFSSFNNTTYPNMGVSVISSGSFTLSVIPYVTTSSFSSMTASMGHVGSSVIINGSVQATSSDAINWTARTLPMSTGWVSPTSLEVKLTRSQKVIALIKKGYTFVYPRFRYILYVTAHMFRKKDVLDYNKYCKYTLTKIEVPTDDRLIKIKKVKPWQKIPNLLKGRPFSIKFF